MSKKHSPPTRDAGITEIKVGKGRRPLRWRKELGKRFHWRTVLEGGKKGNRKSGGIFRTGHAPRRKKLWKT